MEREEIKSFIKTHYLMIDKLEKLLDIEPTIREQFNLKQVKTYCPAIKIIDTVNDIFSTDCRERTRRKRVVYARHCASYLLRQYTDMTLVEISNVLSNSDHATCSHSIITAKNLIETDPDYAAKYLKIKSILLEEKINQN
jgi:chromosomal replication initiation ATPase DnaA